MVYEDVPSPCFPQYQWAAINLSYMQTLQLMWDWRCDAYVFHMHA